MNETWCDFDMTKPRQLCSSLPVRLNKATLTDLCTQSPAGCVVSNAFDGFRSTQSPGPWRKEDARTKTCQIRYTFVRQLMWVDLSCFMSAPGTLSVVISLVLSVIWIRQTCQHSHLSEHTAGEITHMGIFFLLRRWYPLKTDVAVWAIIVFTF